MILYEENTNKLCEMYVEIAKENTIPDFTEKELHTTLGELSKGKSTGSDNIPAEVFIHCGDLLVNLLLQILNSIKNSDVIPEQWNHVIISTIYKNKGRKKELVNHRGIFLTQVVSKIYEKLNKTSVSEYIEKISKIQSGSRPNRSCCDQLFIVRSYIGHSEYQTVYQKSNIPNFVRLSSVLRLFMAPRFDRVIVESR